MYHHSRILLFVSLIAVLAGADRAAGCPFCSPTSQTFSQEIHSADVVAIATLKELAPPRDVEDLSQSSFDATRNIPRATFEIGEILKGAEHLGDLRQIEAVYFGDAEVGTIFMIVALGAPDLDWTTPLRISDRVREYLLLVAGLTGEGPERLAFYQEYLEDQDDVLARDAYDEFSRAPYADVKALREQMDREQLITWIQDTQLQPSRRRLYLTMLGVCGQAADADMLEEMIRSDDRQTKSALDAMIASYLTLIGEDGIPLIEELLIKNQDAEYTDTYASIMALRFHADQGDPISSARAVEALRHMLDRPQLADLVVPDLARWEDWDSMPRLIQLFKDSTDENSWVRVPVVNYLRRCPLPEAQTAIAELEQIDPDAVRRARTFFPTGPSPGTDVAANASEKVESPVESENEPQETPDPENTESPTVADTDDLLEVDAYAAAALDAPATPDVPVATSGPQTVDLASSETVEIDGARVSRTVWTVGLSFLGLFAVVYAIKLTLT